jgi:hypothetical protein
MMFLDDIRRVLSLFPAKDFFPVIMLLKELRR